MYNEDGGPKWDVRQIINTLPKEEGQSPVVHRSVLKVIIFEALKVQYLNTEGLIFETMNLKVQNYYRRSYIWSTEGPNIFRVKVLAVTLLIVLHLFAAGQWINGWRRWGSMTRHYLYVIRVTQIWSLWFQGFPISTGSGFWTTPGASGSLYPSSFAVWRSGHTAFRFHKSPNTLHFMIHWSHKSLVTLHFGLTDSLATMSMFLSVSVRRHDRRGQRVETALHRRAHEEIRGRLQRGWSQRKVNWVSKRLECL